MSISIREIRTAQYVISSKLYNKNSHTFDIIEEPKRRFGHGYLIRLSLRASMNSKTFDLDLNDIQEIINDIEAISTLLQDFIYYSVEEFIKTFNCKSTQSPLQIAYSLYNDYLNGLNDLVEDVQNNRINSSRIVYRKSGRVSTDKNVIYGQNIGLSKAPMLENGKPLEWPGIDFTNFFETFE